MWDAGFVVFGTGLLSFVVVWVLIASVRGGSALGRSRSAARWWPSSPGLASALPLPIPQ